MKNCDGEPPDVQIYRCSAKGRQNEMSGKFEEMEVFARIYESGGLSAAARLTGLTPSGVSRLIKRLEARLGAQLFHRNSRSLQPTPEGEVFYRHCVEIMQCLEHAEAAIAPAHGGSTVLRVNTLPTFAVYQLAKVMPEFRSEERRVGKECRSRWAAYRCKKTGRGRRQIECVW